MEFFNKIELKGIVGNVSTYEVADKRSTAFSLMTESTENIKGDIVINVTWFNCHTYNEIVVSKGDYVHVIGRVRTRRYTDADGVQMNTFDVIVNAITILDK